MEIPVHDLSGNVVETIEFDESCLGKGVRKALLQQVIVGYEANRRVGTASSKTRSEVMGTGKKPWRQKGLGRARVGTKRNPVWRGGGVAHGPKPRDWRQKLPKKARRAALKSALLGKLRDGEIKVVTEINPSEPKTKPMNDALEALGVKAGCLVVLREPNPVAWKSCRNIPNVDMMSLGELNARSALRRRHVLFTRDAFAALPEEMNR